MIDKEKAPEVQGTGGGNSFANSGLEHRENTQKMA